MTYQTPELQLVGAAQNLVLARFSGSASECIAKDNPIGNTSNSLELW